MENRYEQIGVRYSSTRREDPQLKARILAALGSSTSVINVGAGAGSYEPRDRSVLAVEPSRVMIAQRPKTAAPAVLASADHLPLADRSFDAAMVVLSLHHWDRGQERGVRELRRVARGPIAIATIDVEVSSAMWLIADYLPEAAELDRRTFPRLEQIADWLGGTTRAEIVEVSRSTPDWTLMSFWAHPERVLDAQARQATSGFARMAPEVVARVVNAVRTDLASGAWDARHGQLRARETHDTGLRLLINTP
jgi:SAM-dependent methyltransferase